MSFMLEARLLPVLTASWHRGRRYCPSSGQDTGLIQGGFYSRSLALSGPSPGGPASPLFAPRRVSTKCVFVYVCHLANLSQSPGSDKNAAALRGHTLEWNEVRGAR